PDGSASRGMVTPQADAAIERGLAYLAENGHGGAYGIRSYRGNVAVSSLAALAFMAAGNQPQRGKYGRLVTEALRYVLNLSEKNGMYRGVLSNPVPGAHGPM